MPDEDEEQPEQPEQPVTSAPEEGGAEAATDVSHLAVGTILVVSADTVTLWLPGREPLALERGTRFTVTELRDEWIGGEAVLAESKHRGWLRKRDIETAFSPVSDGHEEEE
jgi:hypothetical protein